MTIRELIEAGKLSLDTVVLGELPRTADGAVVGLDADVFWARRLHDGRYQIHRASLAGKDASRVDYVEHLSMYGEHLPHKDCYSTHAAAEAARSKT